MRYADIHIVCCIPAWDSTWMKDQLIRKEVNKFLEKHNLDAQGYQYFRYLDNIRIQDDLNITGDSCQFVCIGVATKPDDEPDDYIRY